MIDTVHMGTYVPDQSGVASRFEQAREYTVRHNGQERVVVTGYLRSLRVRISNNRLSIRGSLPGFIGKSTLTRDDLQDVHHELESLLVTALGDSAVWRMDVFADLPVLEHPSVYLSLLSELSRHQKVQYGSESVTFRTDRRSLLFYDKQAEQLRKGKPWSDPEWSPLRYEMQLKTRLRAQVGQPVRLEDLHDQTLLFCFIRRWESEYARITKVRGLAPPSQGVDPDDYLKRCGLQCLGLQNYLHMIRYAYKAGTLKRSRFYTLQAWAKRLAQDPQFAGENDLVSYLDSMVAATAEEMRDRAAD